MLFQRRYNSSEIIIIKLLLIFAIFIHILKFLHPQSYPKLLSSDTIYEWHRDQTNERFCVWFNFTTNLLKSNSNDEITLCTHATIGYSRYLFYYPKNWKSFISASLFIDLNDELGILSLLSFLRLHRCSLEMKTYVSTHLVWIKSKEEETCLEGYQKFMNAISKNYFSSCKKDKNYFKHNSLLNHKSSISTIKKYPPNTLRNIARFGASTNFHLIADMENQFSENAASNLKLILKTLLKSNNNATTAIVIRRFEFDEKEINVPKNINELNKMIQNKKAFEFHHFITPEAHAIDNLKEWLDYSSTNNIQQIKIDFVPYKNYFWEPQLLVHSSHPFHFEGFPIRHTDQQTLPYRLCRAKINFAVISHVFSFHRGIKFKQTKSENQAQQASRETAKFVSKHFIQFLDYAYPNTKLICGEWKS